MERAENMYILSQNARSLPIKSQIWRDDKYDDTSNGCNTLDIIKFTIGKILKHAKSEAMCHQTKLLLNDVIDINSGVINVGNGAVNGDNKKVLQILQNLGYIITKEVSPMDGDVDVCLCWKNI
jgi:hypothetical protein